MGLPSESAFRVMGEVVCYIPGEVDFSRVDIRGSRGVQG